MENENTIIFVSILQSTNSEGIQYAAYIVHSQNTYVWVWIEITISQCYNVNV